jgi:hypothetical protein
MKKYFLLVAITALLFACKSKDSKKETGIKTTAGVDSTLITDSSWGLITAHSDFESLKRDYGAANILDTSICGPECADTIAVTILFPNTPKEMIVYWADGLYHKTVGMIGSSQPNSPYHNAKGLKIGSTLADLQREYGGRLDFSGFGWDYGGYINSYGEGALKNSHMNIRLDLANHPGPDSLYGDRSLNTDMPVVKNNMDKIVITDIQLSFFKFD